MPETAEEERLRELRERAAKGDKEAATLLSLLVDRDPSPRAAIKTRAREAYALPEITLEQQRANIATDTATGTAAGIEEYEDKDKWRGTGLLGTPFAGLMNMRKAQKDKKKGRINTEVLGLRRAREAKRLAAEQAALRQGNISANRSTEALIGREEGRDFTVDRYGVKRGDEATDRTEQRAHTAGLLKAKQQREDQIRVGDRTEQRAHTARLLQEKQDREDRIRGETDPLKPSAGQTSTYNASMDSLDSISSMDTQRSNLSSADKRLYSSAMKDIGTTLAPSWAKGVVSETAYGGSPSVQSLRAEERKVMAAFRLLISGKQVTGPEFIREADWSPTAAGLTLEERERRWDIVRRETANTVSRHEGTFSDYVDNPYEAKAQDTRLDSIQAEIDRINAEADELERARR